jgi:hypothetical protein
MAECASAKTDMDVAENGCRGAEQDTSADPGLIGERAPRTDRVCAAQSKTARLRSQTGGSVAVKASTFFKRCARVATSEPQRRCLIIRRNWLAGRPGNIV